MKKILSIDGGGIRGIIPGQILVSLEKKLQTVTSNPDARIAHYFDFFAGSSTGGILTCLLLCPDDKNPLMPKFTAKQAVDLYINNGTKIFDTSFWQNITNGLLDEKYPSAPIEKILLKYFGKAKLSNLLKPCIITAYDIMERKTHFFAQHDYNRKGDGGDFYIRDVCRATSAAPTYFEAALVKSISGVSYPLIDGGIFANDPALCAYSEVRNAKGLPTAKDMFILSIGTGGENKSYDYADAKNWGALGWIKPVIDIMMSASAETTHYHLLKMFAAQGNQRNYMRIQPSSLGNAKPDMDDASPNNLIALKEVGIKTAETYNDDLDTIVDILLAGEDKVEF